MRKERKNVLDKIHNIVFKRQIIEDQLKILLNSHFIFLSVPTINWRKSFRRR